MSAVPQERRSTARPVVLLVVGSILGLIALGVLAGAGALVWADKTQRDSAGYFTSSPHHFSSGASAITHEGTKISGIPSGIDVSKLARIRIRAESTNGHALFVGIARTRDVDKYLASVPHSQVTDFGVDPFKAVYRQIHGSARPAAPGSSHRWVASATGTGRIAATWRVHRGTWSVVLMNADGSRGVNADVSFGADVHYLGWISVGLFAGGAIVLGLAVLLIVVGARGLGRAQRGPPVPLASTAAARAESAIVAGSYPATLSARLDEPLSRWLWVVKWLLLIPHLIVLAFLWVAFVVLTVVAWFAIVFTGRYPRGIFDFNVGVLRWSWRVSYYGYGALGTDRYPPFSLDREADSPASLDVAYPERLSRALPFAKWLLAVPHLVIVGVLVGGGAYWVDRWHFGTPWSGLIGLLAFFAGVALVFTGNYPRGLFDFIIGLNRWLLRVIAYVALMTDEYPPFRLDQGGDEPEASPTRAVTALR